MTLKENYYIPTKALFGAGTLSKTAEEVASLGLKSDRVAIVASSSAVSLGYADRLKEQFCGEVALFSPVPPEPSVEDAEEIGQRVKEFNPTLIVAVGGGSALDVAKAVSVFVKLGGDLRDYLGAPDAIKERPVPIVAVPTTAGSGSEITPYAVLTDKKRLRKAPLISPYLFPALAVVDPELTLSLPRRATISSGVDALTHAVESFLSKRATPISRLYSLKAVELIFKFLPRAAGNGSDLEARSGVMYGSMLGGMAISLAGAGLVHSLSHVLGALKGVPHGIANGLFLVPVLRFYSLAVKSELEEMGRAIGLGGDFREVLKAFEELLSELGVPSSLSLFSVREEEVSLFVEKIMEKRFLLNHLPKIPEEREIEELVSSSIFAKGLSCRGERL